MKEAKVKNVFDGELFYDNETKKFYRRELRQKCIQDPEHIIGVAASDGSKICFPPDTKVVV